MQKIPSPRNKHTPPLRINTSYIDEGACPLGTIFLVRGLEVFTSTGRDYLGLQSLKCQGSFKGSWRLV